MVVPLQLQPVPLAVFNVRLAGRVSVMVTVPEVLDVPNS